MEDILEYGIVCFLWIKVLSKTIATRAQGHVFRAGLKRIVECPARLSLFPDQSREVSELVVVKCRTGDVVPRGWFQQVWRAIIS